MAYFPTELLKCVAFVGYRNQRDELRLAGSGFWVSRPGPPDLKGAYRPTYFITAAHVIEKARTSSGDKSILLRVNTKPHGYIWYKTPEVCWMAHPDDPAVDLAILKIGVEDSFDQAAWPLELCVQADKIDTNPDTGDRRIELGDELCFAGLFYPHKGEKRNIPIVRVGNVSALRGEPVLNKDGVPMDVYLSESRSIGGLSGSPVFIDVKTAKTVLPPTYGYMAAAYWPSSIERFRLFGVIHGHFGDEPSEDAVADDGKQRVGINFGIAMIIPAEKVVETLAQYIPEEAREADNLRKAGVSTSPQTSNVSVGIAGSKSKA